jgi:hypothetical protein
VKSLITAALGLALTLTIANPAIAQKATWKDELGRPIPETEARRSVDGLGGSLLVTPDADWRQKWDTPSNTVPQFKEAKYVDRGQQIFVLIFFSNPKLSADSRANLTCDLKLIRPDGTISTSQPDVVCFQGEAKDGPYNTYLAAPVMGFTGDAADRLGTWTVRVRLKDNLRNTVLPLETSFVLK